jgi:hypothetical protein
MAMSLKSVIFAFNVSVERLLVMGDFLIMNITFCLCPNYVFSSDSWFLTTADTKSQAFKSWSPVKNNKKFFSMLK